MSHYWAEASQMQFFLLLEDSILITIRIKITDYYQNLLVWGISVPCLWLCVHVTTVVWPWDWSLSKSSPPIMQGNLRAFKVSPFWVKKRSWALQEHLRCFDQPCLFGDCPKWTPTVGNMEIWPSAPTASAVPLFLPTKRHSSCQENDVRWQTEGILRCNW